MGARRRCPRVLRGQGCGRYVGHGGVSVPRGERSMRGPTVLNRKSRTTGYCRLGRLVALAALLAVLRAVAANGTATVERTFAEAGGEAEVTVSLDCPEMAFFTLDVHLPVPETAYVDGSAVANDGRVTTSGFGETFTFGEDVLRFKAENLSFTSISAGSDWLFRFRVSVPAASSSIITCEIPDGIQHLPQTTTGTTPTFDLEHGRLTAYSLLGKPAVRTVERTATVTVSGGGVTHYRYQLDVGGFSVDPVPVATPISLSSLSPGQHRLQVIAQDADGGWQDEAVPLEHVWTVVDVSNPVLTQSTPAMNVPFNPDVDDPVWLTWGTESGAANHSYGWVLDTQPGTEAPFSVIGTDPPGALAGSSFASGDTAYYLHLRTNETLAGDGLWTETAHYGPWLPDRTAPTAVLANPPPDPDNRDSIVLSAADASAIASRIVPALRVKDSLTMMLEFYGFEQNSDGTSPSDWSYQTTVLPRTSSSLSCHSGVAAFDDYF